MPGGRPIDPTEKKYRDFAKQNRVDQACAPSCHNFIQANGQYVNYIFCSKCGDVRPFQTLKNEIPVSRRRK